MNLDGHYRTGRFIFWFAQIIGVATVVALIVFMLGSIISELIGKTLDVREDYNIIVIALLEILVGISYKISWRRKRLGPILILIFTGLICVLWGPESINFIWLHGPVLFSGLLLLFYSFYKEWILRRKA